MQKLAYARVPVGTTGGRQPVLDGVRGLAVSLVLYHHFVLYSGFAPTGVVDALVFHAGKASWMGVDLFFVLSGFLITRVLLDAKGSDHYFRNFYGRRALRIFPLYYMVLAVTFILAPLLLASPAIQELESQQAWYWLYLTNIDVALNRWQDPGHFGHFWSLAVEEQFYLVWPLVVFGCRRKTLLWVGIGCFGGALVLRFLVPLWLPPLANYVLMPTRMDGFAAGALVAVLARAPGGLRSLGRWPHRTLAAAVLAALMLFMWRRGWSYVDPVVSTLGYSVIALGFAAMIVVLLVGPQSSQIRPLFSGSALRALGKYSYAIYVFHHPIVMIMRDSGLHVGLVPSFLGSQLPGLLVFAGVAFALSMTCALLSWRLLEQPFLALKDRLPMRARTVARGTGVPAAHR